MCNTTSIEGEKQTNIQTNPSGSPQSPSFIVSQCQVTGARAETDAGCPGNIRELWTRPALNSGGSHGMAVLKVWALPPWEYKRESLVGEEVMSLFVNSHHFLKKKIGERSVIDNLYLYNYTIIITSDALLWASLHRSTWMCSNHPTLS